MARVFCSLRVKDLFGVFDWIDDNVKSEIGWNMDQLCHPTKFTLVERAFYDGYVGEWMVTNYDLVFVNLKEELAFRLRWG